jgi:hypothetical protein
MAISVRFIGVLAVTLASASIASLASTAERQGASTVELFGTVSDAESGNGIAGEIAAYAGTVSPPPGQSGCADPVQSSLAQTRSAKKSGVFTLVVPKNAWPDQGLITIRYCAAGYVPWFLTEALQADSRVSPDPILLHSGGELISSNQKSNEVYTRAAFTRVLTQLNVNLTRLRKRSQGEYLAAQRTLASRDRAVLQALGQLTSPAGSSPSELPGATGRTMNRLLSGARKQMQYLSDSSDASEEAAAGLPMKFREAAYSLVPRLPPRRPS